MAEHCNSLRRKYTDSTDNAVRSFIQLPIADMSYHIRYSLDTEYQQASPYARCTIGIPGPLRAARRTRVVAGVRARPETGQLTPRPHPARQDDARRADDGRDR